MSIISSVSGKLEHWTFEDIFTNIEKFEKIVKSATVAKNSIIMQLFFIGPDNQMIHTVMCSWYFYFRRPAVTKFEEYNSDEEEQFAEDWAPFAEHAYYSAFHGVFCSLRDFKIFSNFYKSFKLNRRQFKNAFADWQL